MRTMAEVVEYLSRYRQDHPEQRIGQAYSNALYQIEPALSNSIRGTVADPWHASSPVDTRISLFFAHLMPYFD